MMRIPRETGCPPPACPTPPRRSTPGGAALILGLLFLGEGLAAEVDFDAWSWRAQVTAPRRSFVSLPLTPEIFDACDKPDLTDLRLSDARGVEVPCAVVRERERREEREIAGKELNRDQPDAGTSRLTIDFQTSLAKNRVAVKTEGDNFRRRVRIEGSPDQERWSEILKEGWIFAVARERGGRFETLDIGENTYRYLRVWVEKMPDEPEPPRIEAVTCRHVVVEQPEETTRRAVLESYTHDPETRTSTALVDFGLRHLPIVRLSLSLASDPQRVFRRECRIWGRNSLEHVERIRFETDELGEERVVETSWSFVGAATVLRDASGRESLELRFPAPYRYAKIEVANADSPPLDIGGVDAVLHPVHLVFEPAGGTSFTLYAGNPEAAAARYEARATLESLDARKLPKATAGPLEALAGARPRPTQGGQTMVWILMALAVLATAALLWYTAAAGARGGDKAPE
ncbi:MAG: DUF3999 family protein [Planctomycetes bacterium]|nr:DUF3999 family protein [Planctomycetota bacterium]